MIASALAASTPRRETWNSWRRQEPTLDHACFYDLRCELHDRSTPFDRRDNLLASLIRVGRTDPNARLAVVVLLLPGLRRAVSRYGRFLDTEDRWATILAALWEKAGRYDADRRPHHVASNLIWDATGVLLQASHREETHVKCNTLLSDELEAPHVASATEEAEILQSAIAAGALTPTDATLIDATRLRGVDLRSAALLLGLSYEAAKKRRRRAEVAWAEWLGDQNRQGTSPLPAGPVTQSRTANNAAA